MDRIYMMGESEVGVEDDAKNSGSFIEGDNVILNEDLRLRGAMRSFFDVFQCSSSIRWKLVVASAV